MIKDMKRILWDWWEGFRDWVNAMDSCELCGNEQSDYMCVGCQRRICAMCESGYYADENLCSECRKNISPEEEAEDKKEAADDLAKECSCPAVCELDEDQHAFIAKYGVKEEVSER